MASESFSERNRRRREAASFKNLYAYARRTGVADPKRTAQRTARQLHGEGADGRRTNAAPASRPDEAASVPRNLEDRTKEQLYARAQELEIDGRSQMTKDELVAAIRAR